MQRTIENRQAFSVLVQALTPACLTIKGMGEARQALMLAMGHKLPKSKCGYRAVREAMIAEFGIDQNQCIARVDDSILAAVREFVGPWVASAVGVRGDQVAVWSQDGGHYMTTIENYRGRTHNAIDDRYFSVPPFPRYCSPEWDAWANCEAGKELAHA